MSVKNIVLFRALALGDLLCAIPAVRALRRSRPDVKITLAGLAWARALLDLYPHYFDEFIEFPGGLENAQTLPNSEALRGFFERCRKSRFDLAIQMHGNGTVTNHVVKEMGARITAGFFDPSRMSDDPKYFLPYPKEGHEIKRLVDLMAHLGFSSADYELEFPEAEGKEDPWNCFLRDIPYICMHPGARLASRRWPADRFAKVGDYFSRQGYQIVLTGTASEEDLVREVEQNMMYPAVNLAGKTSLRKLAPLFLKSRLLICNDTGVSHIAAALKVPSVVLVMGSDPERWAPLNRSRHSVLVHTVECRPCLYDTCPIGHPCAYRIKPNEVIAAAEEKLDQFRTCGVKKRFEISKEERYAVT